MRRNEDFSRPSPKRLIFDDRHLLTIFIEATDSNVDPHSDITRVLDGDNCAALLALRDGDQEDVTGWLTN